MSSSEGEYGDTVDVSGSESEGFVPATKKVCLSAVPLVIVVDAQLVGESSPQTQGTQGQGPSCREIEGRCLKDRRYEAENDKEEGVG